MFGVWSFLRQFMYTKFIIVTDDDVDIRDWKEVVWALTTRVDPARDTLLVEQHADRLPRLRVAGRGARQQDGHRRDQQVARRDAARVGPADRDGRGGQGARRRAVGIAGAVAMAGARASTRRRRAEAVVRSGSTTRQAAPAARRCGTPSAPAWRPAASARRRGRPRTGAATPISIAALAAASLARPGGARRDRRLDVAQAARVRRMRSSSARATSSALRSRDRERRPRAHRLAPELLGEPLPVALELGQRLRRTAPARRLRRAQARTARRRRRRGAEGDDRAQRAQPVRVPEARRRPARTARPTRTPARHRTTARTSWSRARSRSSANSSAASSARVRSKASPDAARRPRAPRNPVAPGAGQVVVHGIAFAQRG